MYQTHPDIHTISVSHAIIIDGLDGCGRDLPRTDQHAAQIRVLNALRYLAVAQDIPPIRLLITSQAHVHLEQYFQSGDLPEITLPIFVGVNTIQDDEYSDGALLSGQDHAWDLLKSMISSPMLESVPHQDRDSQVYARIRGWSQEKEREWSILWISYNSSDEGFPPAQERAKTIMKNLQKRLSDDHLLAASVYCSNVDNQQFERQLVPNLAYQLAESRPELRTSILQAIEDNPTLLSAASIQVQFENLIAQPLLQTSSNVSTLIPHGPKLSPSYFLIDSLHHFCASGAQSTLIYCISHLLSLYKGSRLTFIISSGAELDLCSAFLADRVTSIHVKPLMMDSSSDHATFMAGASSNPTPVLLRQTYSPLGTDHFYTIDDGEFNRIPRIGYSPITHNGHDSVGRVYTSMTPFSIPLFRLFNEWNGDHFFTVDLDEVKSAGRIGYKLEGIACFVIRKDAKVPQAVPLYRFWSPAKQDHAITSSVSYREELIRDGYEDEGIFGYILPV
ncbi:hypothetical protein CVT24_010073 [Panaeolus cyanescens]|uniref:DUF5648 domain-containing protein n=1 Tax=Panaeolus cyanescens TaxID=181874 RepID=A0A409W929_9AGAR|nr:hypothetical protein CVT24_010073 [Panaeolus cyanescens]